MLTAIDINTRKKVDIAPIAESDGGWYDLYLEDANTGNVIWWDGVDGHWAIDLEDNDVYNPAERISGIVGEDNDAWEARANEKLAEYGLRLGAFDEKAGDRYELAEA